MVFKPHIPLLGYHGQPDLLTTIVSLICLGQERRPKYDEIFGARTLTYHSTPGFLWLEARDGVSSWTTTIV